jgi:hypothetical protein
MAQLRTCGSAREPAGPLAALRQLPARYGVALLPGTMGWLLGISILWTIGIIVLIIGIVFLVLGQMDHAIGGRKYWY